MDFEKHMEDIAPKKAPPPPPAKKGPPPPPPKKEASAAPAINTPIGEPESGVINGPGGPGVAADSPEAAKKIQGIGDKPEPVKDELDGMELHQLKALATAIGADFLPRARNASVIAAIRARRAEMAATGEVISDLDSGAEPELDRVAMAAQAVEARAMVEAELDKVEDAPAEKKAPPPPPAAKSPIDKVMDLAKTMGIEGGPKTFFTPEKTFALFINCAPQHVSSEMAMTVSRFVNGLMPDFKEATGFDDYRQVDFGKGVGMMAASIVDELENGRHPEVIVCDTRTQEGFTFCATFERFASTVVRGF